MFFTHLWREPRRRLRHFLHGGAVDGQHVGGWRAARLRPAAALTKVA